MVRKYRPDISGDEDDDGEGREPSVSNGEKHVARHAWSCVVPQREKHHPHCEGQRDHVKHPHLSLSDGTLDGSDRIGSDRIGFRRYGSGGGVGGGV